MKILFIMLTILGGIASLIAIYEFYKRAQLSRFKVVRIKMNSPRNENGNYIRQPANKRDLKFLSLEENLRKSAYATTPLTTDASFYDDRDMSTDYNLFLVYHKSENTPLLSARVYWNPNDILKELQGDNKSLEFKIKNPISGGLDSWKPDELDKYEFGECFVTDRMSGALGDDLYLNNKNKIFSLLYKKIYKDRKKSKVIYALARRSTKEKLLSTYLRVGLRIVGMTSYFGNEHWVLEGRFDCIKKHFKFIRILSRALIFHR